MVVGVVRTRYEAGAAVGFMAAPLRDQSTRTHAPALKRCGEGDVPMSSADTPPDCGPRVDAKAADGGDGQWMSRSGRYG